MPQLAQQLADYESYHRTAGNKLTHAVGIPLIGMTLLGLGSRVGIELGAIPGSPTIDLGMAFAVGLFAAFLAWHVGLAIGAGLVLVVLYSIGSALPTGWLIVLLAAGIALQYVGHVVFEGNRPAFHDHARHMIVGPLWVVARLFAGLRLFRFDPGPPSR